jgi:spore germination protein GerM
MSQHYDALMSYTRFDDQHDGAFLTAFRERLSHEVRAQSGQEFRIFQDTEAIKWGEQFEARIDHALDTITFFIPILTPSFFASEFCRYELEKFLAREQELGRSDLVLPVYYIEVAALEDKHLRDDDPLAQTLAARQRIDWRELRFEPFDAPQVRRTLAQMAQQIAQRVMMQERERKRGTTDEPEQQNLSTTSHNQTDKVQRKSISKWFSSLSFRDRMIYGTLLSVMLMIVSIYVVLALQLLVPDQTTTTAVAPSPTPSPMAVPATHTSAPAAPTLAPSSTAVGAVLPPASTRLTRTQAATPTAAEAPVANGERPQTSREPMVLYFQDASATLFVPQTRIVRVAENPTAVERAEAALRERVRGPLNGSGLNAAVPGNVQLLGVDLVGDTLIVDLDTGGDALSDEAIRAIVLTLTDLPSLGSTRVQVQANGSNVGLGESDDAASRFAYNVHNPLGLDETLSSRDASFLTLYYVNDATGDYVRVTRLVPRTQSAARATVNELLDGLGSQYAGLLSQPIPQGTTLIDVYFDIEDAPGTLVVNLSAAFAQAPNREAALETLVLSLTNLSTVERVDVRVDGQPLGDVWGADFAGPFGRPPLNPEGL